MSMQASSTSSDSDDMENFIKTKHPTTGQKLAEVCIACSARTLCWVSMVEKGCALRCSRYF